MSHQYILPDGRRIGGPAFDHPPRVGDHLRIDGANYQVSAVLHAEPPPATGGRSTVITYWLAPASDRLVASFDPFSG